MRFTSRFFKKATQASLELGLFELAVCGLFKHFPFSQQVSPFLILFLSKQHNETDLARLWALSLLNMTNILLVETSLIGYPVEPLLAIGTGITLCALVNDVLSCLAPSQEPNHHSIQSP